MVENLILNPSFEEDPFLYGWFARIWGTGVTIPENPFSEETVDVYDGLRAVRCTVQEIVEGYLQFVVGTHIVPASQLNPTEEYRLRVVYKSTIPLILVVNGSLLGEPLLAEEIVLPASSEWIVSPVLSFVIPSQGLDYFQLLVMNDNQVGEYIVDLFELYSAIPSPTYDLTVESGVGGTTDPTPGTYTFDSGASAIVTAYPDSGYYFQNWNLDGKISRENPITITMDRSYILTPIFSTVPPTEYTLTISGTAGGVTEPPFGSHTYIEGEKVQVTATPDSGYNFDHWELNGVAHTENPIVVEMSADRSLYSVFSEIPPGKGALECHAYVNDEEVTALVEIEGVGSYDTPFTVQLDPRTYNLSVTYSDQKQTETITITEGETNRKDFHFKKVISGPFGLWKFPLISRFLGFTKRQSTYRTRV